MVTKVFVYLTHLKQPEISQTYLNISVWLEHLTIIHLEYYEFLTLLSQTNIPIGLGIGTA